MSDAGVAALAEHCPALELLDVSFCHALTDKGMMAVLEQVTDDWRLTPSDP